MDSDTYATIVGFAGGIAILGSFAGVALGWLSVRARGYHLANLGGALALVVSGLASQAWPSVTVNVVWALISAAALRPRSPVRGRTSRALRAVAE